VRRATTAGDARRAASAVPRQRGLSRHIGIDLRRERSQSSSRRTLERDLARDRRAARVARLFARDAAPGVERAQNVRTVGQARRHFAAVDIEGAHGRDLRVGGEDRIAGAVVREAVLDRAAAGGGDLALHAAQPIELARDGRAARQCRHDLSVREVVAGRGRERAASRGDVVDRGPRQTADRVVKKEQWWHDEESPDPSGCEHAARKSHLKVSLLSRCV